MALDTVSNWCRRNPAACIQLGFGLLPRPNPGPLPNSFQPENCPGGEVAPGQQPYFPPIFTSNGKGDNKGGANATNNPATAATGGASPTPPNNKNDKDKNDKNKLPETREELYKDLESKGFKPSGSGASNGGYEVWKGPNGTKVDIKPTGEVIRTQRKWNSTGTKKYPERQDYWGNRLPDQSHSTGHFVK